MLITETPLKTIMQPKEAADKFISHLQKGPKIAYTYREISDSYKEFCVGLGCLPTPTNYLMQAMLKTGDVVRVRVRGPECRIAVWCILPTRKAA